MRKWSSLLFVMIFLCVGIGFALANGNVVVRDDANLLSAADRDRIQGTAQVAPFGVVVWVANGGYAQNKPSFVRAADGLVGSDSVVVALDVQDKWSHVAARRNAGLTEDAVANAMAAGKASFHTGNWSEGIVEELNTLVAAAPSRSAPVPMANTSLPAGTIPGNPERYGQGGGFHFGAFLMMVLVIGALVMIARRLMGGGQPSYGGYGTQPINQGGMNPGGWPAGPNQGGMGGYGPGVNQGGRGGGIGSNLVSGGIGAVGGGLLGYELGKMSGERENQGMQQGGGAWGIPGGAGDPGGIVESDNGASNTPDFGGGGSDFGGGDFGGGGGDFGGGGGGDF